MRRLLGFARTLYHKACLSITIVVGLLWAGTTIWGGHFIVFQGPYRSDVFSIIQGNFVIQLASISPDPERPATLGRRQFSGNALLYRFNPASEIEGWSRFGLITTLQTIPYDNGGSNFPNPPEIIQLMSTVADCRSFVIPLWAVFIVLCIPLVRSGIRSRREQIRAFRLATGRCINCGYDLRASAGRCPECGAERMQQVAQIGA